MQNLTKFSQTAAGNISTPKNLAVGGTLTVTGAQALAGAVVISNSTASTTSTTGALKVAGGVGVAGAVNVGTTLGVTGAVTLGNTVTNGIFVSAASGSGNVLSSSKTAIDRVHADDGGVALTTGSMRASLARVLVSTAVVGGSFSLRGAMGQVKIDKVIETSGHVAGVEGYVEATATGEYKGMFTGVRGVVDLPSGAVISAGKFISGLMAFSVNLGGTHTGKAVAIDVPTPDAGTWDALLHVGPSSGCTTAGTTKTTPGGVGTWLNVYIDGTINYIPCYASTTT